jgi:hypothetical protein
MDASIEVTNNEGDTTEHITEEFHRLTVQPWLPRDEGGEEITAGPLDWCNAASVEFDEDDDAVRVSISVGSPMGGFTFTIRRLPEDAPDRGGQLIMHLPHPNQPSLHAPLGELHEGAYVIDGIG